jgi:hypothetical protein
MGKNLLSIDWDYFIPIKREWGGSYIESKTNLISLWYMRYFKGKKDGQDIEKIIDIGKKAMRVWDSIYRYFNISNNAKMYVSESHKLSYDIAKENNCKGVISFDAHSDLGYGGIKSLNFEVNCANWLGKLLKERVINKANIIYSPYTYEKKEDFNEMNKFFNINYSKGEVINRKVDISVIHICRSGAWTPPWLDEKFYNFVNGFKKQYEVINCPHREWNPDKLSLSEKLDILYKFAA